MFRIFRKIILSIFRRVAGRREMILAMVGVRMGERLVCFGAGDPASFAALATKVGLTGRACAVAPNASSARDIEAAAAEEGVLVEVEAAREWVSSHAERSFDVAVVDGNLIADSPAEGQACLRDVFRVLRDGARLVTILRGRRGAGALVGVERTPAGAAIPSLMRALAETGFRPVRLLGEREGLSFVEGFRPAGW